MILNISYLNETKTIKKNLFSAKFIFYKYGFYNYVCIHIICQSKGELDLFCLFFQFIINWLYNDFYIVLIKIIMLEPV